MPFDGAGVDPAGSARSRAAARRPRRARTGVARRPPGARGWRGGSARGDAAVVERPGGPGRARASAGAGEAAAATARCAATPGEGRRPPLQRAAKGGQAGGAAGLRRGRRPAPARAVLSPARGGAQRQRHLVGSVQRRAQAPGPTEAVARPGRRRAAGAPGCGGWRWRLEGDAADGETRDAEGMVKIQSRCRGSSRASAAPGWRWRWPSSTAASPAAGSRPNALHGGLEEPAAARRSAQNRAPVMPGTTPSTPPSRSSAGPAPPDRRTRRPGPRCERTPAPPRRT